MNCFARFLMLPVLSCALATSGQGQSAPGESTTDPSAVLRGKELFAGQRPFRNGGPACASCHAVAGLSFPNGGTLAPDLTQEYAKLGPEGIDVALETLFFPAMTPIYDTRSLTQAERNDLSAFFKQASTSPPPHGVTPIIVLIPIGGCIVLLGISAAVWRNRLHGVRKKLVKSARNGGDVHA